jgi:hypothetical protein
MTPPTGEMVALIGAVATVFGAIGTFATPFISTAIEAHKRKNLPF